MREPVIHSHITDVLPDGHPLQWVAVKCEKCGEAVHASNNECMQTWVETGIGAYCVRCLAELTDGVLEDEWALTDNAESRPA